MSKIEFVKMHGLGNDFVIIDNRIRNTKITKKIISKLSNRKSGAGCDQLIIINPKTKNSEDVRIKIFNPNGDKAEACGNGSRCVAKLLFQESNKSSIKIKSDAGILYAKKRGKNISVNLGKLSSYWKKIPLSKKIDTLNVPIEIKGFSQGVAINIGNPHVVFFGKNLDKIDLKKIGPIVENHELFPKKTNVELVEIINKKKIRMRVWERGAGLTLACGSGACAAVYAAKLKKYVTNDVNVQMKLGSLNINIIKKEAIMTGPAEICFRGEIYI